MDGQGNGLNISGVLVTFMLLASWFFQHQPLHTQRPADEQAVQEVIQQQVPARLW